MLESFLNGFEALFPVKLNRKELAQRMGRNALGIVPGTLASLFDPRPGALPGNMLPRLVRRGKKPLSSLLFEGLAQRCGYFRHASFSRFFSREVQAVIFEINATELDNVTNAKPRFEAHTERKPGFRRHNLFELAPLARLYIPTFQQQTFDFLKKSKLLVKMGRSSARFSASFPQALRPSALEPRSLSPSVSSPELCLPLFPLRPGTNASGS